MDYNSPEFKKLIKNLQVKLKDKPAPQRQKVHFDITKQVGPLDTPTGYPEPEVPSTSKKSIIGKLGSTMKKYVPLKKLFNK